MNSGRRNFFVVNFYFVGKYSEKFRLRKFQDRIQCAKYGTGHTNDLLENIPVPRFFAKKYTRIPEKYTNQ